MRPWQMLEILTPAAGEAACGIWLLFCGDFALWHLPALYDYALAHGSIHVLEHLCFLGTALLLWVQIIPSLPLRPRLALSGRAALLLGTAAFDTVLNYLFLLWPVVLYPAYAKAAARGTVRWPTPLTDQSMAGGVMEVMTMFPLAIAFTVLLTQRGRQQTKPVELLVPDSV